MNSRNLLRLSAAAAIVFLAACSNDTTSPSLVDQTTLTTDVASSAGDAIATDVSAIVGNETSVNLAPPVQGAPASDSVSYTRTRTCFDATGTAIACVPLANVRQIATHWSFVAVVNDTAANGAVFSGNASRVADDTLFRNFTSGTETSRTHDGVGTGYDTLTFVGPNVTRTHNASGIDSVVAVTWNVPRVTLFDPPASGKVIRNVSVHATFTSATRSQTTDVTKRVEVDFNGTINVPLRIDNLTCNLNLLTHRVSNCQ